MRPLRLWWATGLSPRVRGSLEARLVIGGLAGSIPAGAGEPPRSGSARRPSRVYPRGCGGAWLPTSTSPPIMGLSPRVRGSLDSVPLATADLGLSPRVRGSRGLPLERAAEKGSIPAGAGEPGSPACRSLASRVYPRGCGGAEAIHQAFLDSMGLSPRVRGSRQGHPRRRQRQGSIPAGAGEPWRSSHGSEFSRVYPRGCGGAPPCTAPTVWCAGLSPRVRGSLSMMPSACMCCGSIPAGAGEPTLVLAFGEIPRVYPRGCGGATGGPFCSSPPSGLSPRVRGSPAKR